MPRPLRVKGVVFPRKRGLAESLPGKRTLEPGCRGACGAACGGILGHGFPPALPGRASVGGVAAGVAAPFPTGFHRCPENLEAAKFRVQR